MILVWTIHVIVKIASFAQVRENVENLVLFIKSAFTPKENRSNQHNVSGICADEWKKKTI